MSKLLPLFLLLAACCFASKDAARPDIKVKRDAPLQTVWYSPRETPRGHAHHGLSTYSWVCYPIIGQSFDDSRKWLLLNVRIVGHIRFSYASLVFSVDGRIITVPEVSWNRYGSGVPGLFAGPSLIQVKLDGQDELIEAIGAAKEVYITAGVETDNRSSGELTDKQLEVFRLIVEYYKSLKPMD